MCRSCFRQHPVQSSEGHVEFCREPEVFDLHLHVDLAIDIRMCWGACALCCCCRCCFFFLMWWCFLLVGWHSLEHDLFTTFSINETPQAWVHIDTTPRKRVNNAKPEPLRRPCEDTPGMSYQLAYGYINTKSLRVWIRCCRGRPWDSWLYERLCYLCPHSIKGGYLVNGYSLKQPCSNVSVLTHVGRSTLRGQTSRTQHKSQTIQDNANAKQNMSFCIVNMGCVGSMVLRVATCSSTKVPLLVQKMRPHLGSPHWNMSQDLPRLCPTVGKQHRESLETNTTLV